MKNLIVVLIIFTSGCVHLDKLNNYLKVQSDDNQKSCIEIAKSVMAAAGHDVSEIKDPEIVIMSLPDMKNIYKMLSGEELKGEGFYIRATKQVFISYGTPRKQIIHEVLHYYINILFSDMSFIMHHMIIGRMGY